MASVSGPGGGVGNLPNLNSTQASEELKEEQAQNELKEINKKTNTIRSERQVERDNFSVKNEARFSVEHKDEKAARAKLLEQAMPDAVRLVEDIFKVNIDASRILKMQPKVQQEPEFKEAVKALRVAVEEWSKDTLRELENKPEHIELPDLSALKAKKAEPSQESAQAQLAATDAQKAEGQKTDTQRADTQKSDAQKGDAQKTETQKSDKQKTEAQAETQTSAQANDAAAAQANVADAAANELAEQTNAHAAQAEQALQESSQSAVSEAQANDEAAAAQAETAAETQGQDIDAQQQADAAAEAQAHEVSETEATHQDRPLAAEETQQAQESAELQTPSEPTLQDQALHMAEEMQTLRANWPNDAKKAELSEQQKFLLEIMPPPTKPLENPNEPRFDELGNEIVEQEYYDRIDGAIERFGPTEAQVAMYNTLLFQLSQPVVLEPIPGAAAENAQLLTGTTLGGVSGGGAAHESAQYQYQSPAGGVSTVPTNSPIVIKASDALSALALMGDGGDVTMYAMLILMETLKDLNKDIQNKMLWAKVQHKMNDAMRKHMADVLKQLAPLTRPENAEHMPDGTFIHNLQPEPIIGPDGQPTGEVTMVEREVETPYTDQKAEPQDGVTPKPISAQSQVNIIQDKMSDAGLPPPQIRDGGNGTIYMTSAYTYATADHAPMIKERLRNELATLKMDMDKAMLSIQKTTSTRKNVFDNLNKIIKSKSEEWGKSVALLRR